MTFSTEDFSRQIPYYLTAAPEQKELVEGLKALTQGSSKGYYLSKASDPFAAEVLQGDGVRRFKVFSFTTGAKVEVRGIVLSNSCDIALENERAVPPKITFASIIRLSALENRMLEAGLAAEAVQDRLKAIRAQNITSMFYLPKDGALDDEHVALLDDLHSMPLSAVENPPEKMFTLSMAGFYLFTFKLSVHFCRLHENVDRSAKAA